MDKGVQVGQKIILTGWIGLDGMQIVMDKKERELRERFSRAFLAEIKEQADRVPACPAEEVEESFPLILLDVPCSSTGTLARNAELRLRLSPERLREAARMQASILEHAWTRLLPGGTLFYVTCALNGEENENRVEAFAREKGGRLVEKQMFLPAFPGQDALFLAVIRKDA